MGPVVGKSNRGKHPMSPNRSRLQPGLSVLCGVLLALGAAAVPAGAQVVFQTDFETGLPAQMSATGTHIEGCQGLSGLGVAGNQFGGNVMRYNDIALHDVTLTLADLPAHTHVSVGFLLALIDSWDGTELMEISVDGQLLFSHWFQLASGDASSYVAPPGALLSAGIERGWSIGAWYARDRAYDLSVEPAFIDIPHTASTLTLTFRLGAVSGGAAQNWQGGTDESWAIDNLKVTLGNSASATPTPIAAAMLRGNAPNPFNPSTRIRYELPADGAPVRLTIHDLGGRLVRTLVAEAQGAGGHVVPWDGRDDAGQPVAGGVYVYRLSAGASVESRKMVLLK